MSTVLRIVLTGHDPSVSPETIAVLAAAGHAVESVDTGAFEDSWRPQSSPAVVCYGLSPNTAADMAEVVRVVGKLGEVSLLVVVCDDSDASLWDALRTSEIHAIVSCTAGVQEFRHRLWAADALRRLDDMAQLSAGKLERVRKTLQGFRHVDMDTGLSNRRALLERLTDMLYLSQRYKRPISLVVFHVCNHDALTESLDPDDLSLCYEEIADQLQLAQRASDLAARIGPDSFALMLPETPEDGAKIVARRMVPILEERNSVGVKIDILAGVVTSTNGEEESRDLIRAAEDLARMS